MDAITDPPVAINKISYFEKVKQFSGNHALLIFSLVTLALAVIYINPFNETAISDDWAYIWTSNHLVRSGQYILHPWASANIMFQAYWGALFALVGGLSIGTLHLSTIALAVIGLISLYLLALEHNLTRPIAGLLCLCLVANPIFLFLVPTFMTDVPALALQLLALLLYTRGIKKHNNIYMAAGGAATVAGFFIRPTGLALLLGLAAIIWLDKERIKNWKLYTAGVIIPLAGLVFLIFGNTGSNFNGSLNSGSPNGAGQIKFMTQLDTFLPAILLWRPGIYLNYLGLFCMPLAIASLVGLITGKSRPFNLKAFLFFTALIIGALVYQAVGLKADWYFPYMGFNLDFLRVLPQLGQLATILAVPGGIIIGALTWERVGSWKRWQSLPLDQRFLDTTTVFLSVYFILFFNLGDRYLLTLAPFALIVLGRHLQPRLKGLTRYIIVFSLLLVALTAIITRFDQAEQAAEWKASDYALTLGSEPLKIMGPWGWYSSYNFDDYLKTNPDLTNVQYMFDNWRPLRQKESEYQINFYLEPLAGEGWQVVKTFPFSDGFFQEQVVYLLRKPDS